MLHRYTAQLTQKKQVGPDVLLLRFRLMNPSFIDFTAGQYVIADIPQNGSSCTRLYSICSPEYQKHSIELLMRTVSNGIASQYFTRLSAGDIFSFRGPAGQFVLREASRDKIFLATGTGIAPIRSQLYSFFHSHAYTPLSGKLPTMRLLWGVKNAQDAYFADEFMRLQREHAQFSFTICLSQQTSLEGFDLSCFTKGRITDMFNGDKLSSNTDYYICGAPPVVTAITAFLKDRGIEAKNIFFEKF